MELDVAMLERLSAEERGLYPCRTNDPDTCGTCTFWTW